MTMRIDWMRGCGTALVTPFRKDGSIDDEVYKTLVERQIKNGVKILIPCGTTGEAVTLSEEEKIHVIRMTIEVAHSLKAKVIAGTGSNNTAATIDFTRKVRELGADRSEEHTSELQSLAYLVCRLLLEKKKTNKRRY